MYKNRRNQEELSGVVKVTAEECNGNVEKMIRRFSKKVKKERIIEEVTDKDLISLKKTTLCERRQKETKED